MIFSRSATDQSFTIPAPYSHFIADTGKYKKKTRSEIRFQGQIRLVHDFVGLRKSNHFVIDGSLRAIERNRVDPQNNLPAQLKRELLLLKP